MKAITIKQPWASLIVHGIKDIENRSWACPWHYIGKKASLTDDGYYHCVDYINGRFYIGILRHVTYSERGIVLHLDNNEITVSSTTKISIIE